MNTLLNHKIHQDIVNNNLKDIRKDYGIFFTPDPIIDFMVNLIDTDEHSNKKNIAILEPACGLAQFLLGIKRNLPEIYNQANLFGVEANNNIINYLSQLITNENITLIEADYLLWQSDTFFDLIIGNPPYGIPSLSDHYTIKINDTIKNQYKSLYETWYGKYNVYGAFIEKSVKLLKPGGRLIFVVPATFMILDEFKKLRAFLAKNGKTTIIYLGSDVFKPEADVSSAVLDYRKSDVNSALELFEYKNNEIKKIKTDIHWKGAVIKFETDYTQKLESICPYRMNDIYDIRISPRTPEIKNNPYVKKEMQNNQGDYLPLLNGRNLKPNKIVYDSLTGYWIKKSDASKLRGYFEIPHIVVGLGFREKGKIAGALDEKCYHWMGDVYHLLRKDDLFVSKFDMNDQEVLEYINSIYVQRYVKETYRDITYHLSISQLKSLPLPTKKEWEAIKSWKNL